MSTPTKSKDNAFEITWCETNLRWLNGNPKSDENDRKIAYMKERIQILQGSHQENNDADE